MYSIKKVAELLGMQVVTIRAWENRYGVIAPRRSEGGHRIYSEEDVLTLRFLKRQLDENGLKISEAVRLLRQSEPAADLVSRSKEEPPNAPAHANTINRLYESLIAYDSAKANEWVDYAFSMCDVDEVFHRILVPVLYRAGAEWEAGVITVAQEHFASQLVMSRISAFFRVFPVDAALPVTLAFCPEGESHHLGLMLFSLFLRQKGSEVIYLGPDTPFGGLLDMMRKKRVSIVAISVTDSDKIGSLGDWIGSSLREAPYMRFVLGGAAFEEHKPITHEHVHYLHANDWELWYRTHIRALIGLYLGPV
ncbi:MerR family transcriptional regulator [Paenibacillus sacheonensis]|uniref:MerR family transcriptional regulator n=1 Tax=Paenibacillus sacheonensis TaxID=742054 RepID=A0A7X4YQJ8_9BACL|nr:MerR family transcriptional regulator [Paenibacillus sacheonensis]MBM7567827.1 DNA-binding transcriptional MerR regulator [Paenibacillus sacheonensis]NBC70717.1 MerR family transcriptional regulator [Paenibacillus sacheonensis]